MRNLIILLVALFLSACVWTEPYEPGPSSGAEGWDLVLKSASGFNSDAGTVYIQKGLSTWLSIVSRSENEISEIAWKIDGENYSGSELIFKTDKLGQIPFEVSVFFKDGTSQKREFVVISVIELSEADPVRAFISEVKNSKAEVLFLFSKERIAHAKNLDFYYNGSVSNWTKRLIPATDFHYIIRNGLAEKVNEDGKYIGVRLSGLEIGEYSIALVHSDNEWADLSGSLFIRPENRDLAHFYFDGTKIIPQGSEANIYPGKVGDAYFRFTNNGNGTASFFFKFDKELTNNSFIKLAYGTGAYSDVISLTGVSDFPSWAVYNLNFSGINDQILSFRFGDDKNSQNNFCENMESSNFYNEVFNALRIKVAEIE